MRSAFSCRAVARMICEKTKYEPHRHTVRRWALAHLVRGEDYLLTPGRVLIFPGGVEKILAQLYKLEQI